MRTIPAPLQAHLDGGATTLCHCWMLTLRDATRLGFTDHDRALEFDGLTFAPASGLDAGALQSATGLAPDNIEVVGALSDDAITDSDLERGRFDDAEADIFRVNWADPAQRILLFRGSLGETTRGPLAFTAELRGMAHRLDQPQGRAYLRRCDAELGDARCGVTLTPTPGTVTAIAPHGTLTVTGLPGGDAHTHGLLAWTTGANAGTTAPIRTQSGTTLTLWSPPPDPVAPGDTFTATRGCDKRFETCRARFDNAPRFRGFPHMPGDDWMTAYPQPGGTNDGAALQ